MLQLPRSSTLLSVPTRDLLISPQKGSLHLSLVIPTYNERENIVFLIDQLHSLLQQQIPRQFELIVVDDDSPDRTWEVVLGLCSQYPGLKVIRRRREKGLATAVIRGWQVAQGRLLGVIDGDLQHPPQTLLQLLLAMEEGIDLAIASRYTDQGKIQGWPKLRQFLSRGAFWLGYLLLPKVIGRVSDPLSGYFIVRRDAIAGCLLHPTGYKILLEILGRGRVNTIEEVGYVFQNRLEGKSKVTFRQYWEYLLHLFFLVSQS